jgi:histidine triad (HIT) family protein
MMSLVDHCAFCAIVADDAPARRVFEDDNTVAFLNVAPATPGHTLVVPKQHVEDIWSMTDETANAIAVTTPRVANLLRDRLSAIGLNVVQANGAAAGQEVRHVHTHLLPRYLGDDLRQAWWAPALATPAELDEIFRELGGAP